MWYIKFIEKFYILFPKCPFTMVFLLVFYIIVNHFNLGMPIRKCPISLLPGKFAPTSRIIVNKIAAVVLHIPQ